VSGRHLIWKLATVLLLLLLVVDVVVVVACQGRGEG
jgi:hypothetical protein